MKEEFVVYQSKSKQFLMIILAITMTMASIFLIVSKDLEVGFLGFRVPYVVSLVGVFGLIFFGFALFHFIKQLLIGKIIVILTGEGFYDYSSALATKDRLILWKDVADIGVFTISGQDFISVQLNNREEFLDSLSTITRKAAQANLKLGSYEINITLQSAKKVTIQELLFQMCTFYESAHKR